MDTQVSSLDEGLEDPRFNDRVRRHTAPYVNARIDRLTNATLQERLDAGRDAIVARLAELDREWDVDRALMVNFAVAGAVALELGRRRSGFLYLLRVQQAFLLLHAIVGWCPPLALLRRLGFRTAKEIAAERALLVERLRAAPRPELVR
jgi:hypothetical protein